MVEKRDAQTFENRRFRAIALFKKKVSQVAIARQLGVSRQAVSLWVNRYLIEGEQALQRKPRSGRPPKLSAAKKRQLLRLLAAGPHRAGYTTQLWTADRIRRLIRDRFGVEYHVHHIPKLLRECGWSYQKPIGRAIERDEAGIERWLTRDWPRIKKKPGAAKRR